MVFCMADCFGHLFTFIVVFGSVGKVLIKLIKFAFLDIFPKKICVLFGLSFQNVTCKPGLLVLVCTPDLACFCRSSWGLFGTPGLSSLYISPLEPWNTRFRGHSRTFPVAYSHIWVGCTRTQARRPLDTLFCICVSTLLCRHLRRQFDTRLCIRRDSRELLQYCTPFCKLFCKLSSVHHDMFSQKIVDTYSRTANHQHYLSNLKKDRELSLTNIVLIPYFQQIHRGELCSLQVLD